MTYSLTVTADSLNDLMAKVAEIVGAPTPVVGEVAETPKRGRAAKAKAEPESAAPEPEKAEEPAAPAVTMEDLRALVQQLMELPGGAEASVQVVEALGARDEKGLPRLAVLDPAKFDEAKAALLAKIAAAQGVPKTTNVL